MGQTAELRDQTLKVNDFERGYRAPRDIPRADAGNEFVRVNVTVTNTSNRATPLNPPAFTFEDSNGVQRNWQSVPELPNAISSGNLVPEGTTTGNMVLEAPQGDPTSSSSIRR